jgi:hypothetical protein
MSADRIRDYLCSLRFSLWLGGLEHADTLAELESHLREAVEQGRQAGLAPDEAERQALERFGSVKTIASAFQERKAPMQKILLVLGLLSGLFLAYLDALPHWDDTGLLVGGLLLAGGLLALLGYRRPWLLALAIGIWIPLHDIFLSHDPRMLFVLLFPFFGAYAGWAVRLGLRKLSQSA